ncbi:magnesium protoporphyrin IX methyltransferase, chloroplastic [Phragmites australis]|uniref:magnesium protoporphyrin IX methyltransferase, chloroplastic n=1 Tax=Phragmites australis TaxID=29695 RepID=UPI002D793166|nr:magnesium protoporphyrin IX methyltransferase, chloroplastic [Phragmites australis]
MARAGVSTAPLSRLHSPPPATLLHNQQAQPHVLLRPQRKALTTAAALPTAADLPPLSLPAAAAAAAALAAAVSLSDPERRRRAQAEAAGGGDKEAVRAYFNSTGFERWRKIYGSATEGVNRVQLDIREGHAQTVAATLAMLRDGPLPLAGATVCDAGCGTGSLAIPLAAEGADVLASDISAAMVSEAQRQAQLAVASQPTGSPFRMPRFEVRDLESLEGRYDIVVCLDVLIHYPQEDAREMIRHLASLAEKRLLLSFAPKTLYFDFLKRVGELFPGPSKATRAYLHAERDVEDALRDAGWRVANRGFISTQFYFAKLFEAVPVVSP